VSFILSAGICAIELFIATGALADASAATGGTALSKNLNEVVNEQFASRSFEQHSFSIVTNLSSIATTNSRLPDRGSALTPDHDELASYQPSNKWLPHAGYHYDVTKRTHQAMDLRESTGRDLSLLSSNSTFLLGKKADNALVESSVASLSESRTPPVPILVNERPIMVKPLMEVHLGSYSLPILLHVTNSVGTAP
jgi:hypothetical protein